MVTLTENIASKRLKKLLSDVSESHHPIKIKGKKRSAVLVSEDDWRAIEETLYLLSIPGMRKSIIEGLNTPVEKCSEKLKW
jgi:PHD/YefM family antitoxin component YafN of YafNO toxin-antitoxin module